MKFPVMIVCNSIKDIELVSLFAEENNLILHMPEVVDITDKFDIDESPKNSH